MKQKPHTKKLLMAIIVLLAILMIPATAAQAASKPQTGTYQKHFTGKTSDSYRTVIIKKITKSQVVFQINYDRSNPFRSASTAKITGKRKGNTVTFKYKDTGWGETGTGTMKLYKNYIKIKTKSSGKYGGFIGTEGKYYTLKRINSKTKFY